MSSLPESLMRFRTELEDAIRRELEAQATARSNGWRARVLRAVGRHPRRTTLALAAVATAAAAALFVSSPWKTSPGFLEEVQAALTPPEGWIVHMKWKETWTSTDPACTVTLPNEIWIDQTSLQYRVLTFRKRPRDPVCAKGTPSELGGISGSGTAFEFVPPNSIRIGHEPFYATRDPLEGLRDALSSGRAHDDGTTQFDGRTVKRIRFAVEPCPQWLPDCSREPIYAYVDPETLEPVATVSPDTVIAVGGPPPDPGRSPDSTRLPVVRFRLLIRYLTYEYLARTDDNLALTDIRAQHPDAEEEDR